MTLPGETLYVGHEDTWELISLNVQTDSKDSGNLVPYHSALHSALHGALHAALHGVLHCAVM